MCKGVSVGEMVKLVPKTNALTDVEFSHIIKANLIVFNYTDRYLEKSVCCHIQKIRGFAWRFVLQLFVLGNGKFTIQHNNLLLIKNIITKKLCKCYS